MNGLDRAVSRIVLGTIAPVSLMLAGWWGSLGLFGAGPWIAQSALGGVAIGLVLDLTVLRTWLGSLFAQRMPALIAVGAFYSAIIYVMFMGFPVMNLSVGIAGGYVVGRRAALVPGSRSRAFREARLVARVASLMLFVLCCGTALLALGEATIATEVQSMLGLPFTPSAAAIRALIVVGGVGLVVTEYGATILAARWAASR